MRISDWSSDVCSSDLDGSPQRKMTGRNLPLQPTGQFATGQTLIQIHSVLRRVQTTQMDKIITAGSDKILLAANGDFLQGFQAVRRRSEESRVGKEGVSKCRYRWSPYH